MHSPHYEIQSTEIKPYTYRTPLVTIDEHGEAHVTYSNQKPTHIKKLVLLNLVGRDKGGTIVSYEPMGYVNRFLMSHHIDDGKQESDQYSKGLIHFFSFLISLQNKWDEQYDAELFDELVDLPRPKWDFMPKRNSDKVTYQYRAALKKLVLDEIDPNLRMARSTATAYMNAVVKFYSFHIRNGYRFNNPPFKHELVTVHYQAGASSMKEYLSKAVHTTDLRLNFPKSRRNEGGALPSARRDLRPLSDEEWNAVEKILVETQSILKVIDGTLKTASLALEYSLFFLICRYSGLRKEEVASLHLGQIIKPKSIIDNDGKRIFKRTMLEIGVGGQYGSLTKTRDGGNKSRVTILPSSLMQKIYDYSRSERYQKRLIKFKAHCEEQRNIGNDGYFDSQDGVDESKNYLFISQTGKPFFTKLSDINARWNEIRLTVNQQLDFPMRGTPHNLRATFGVWLFRCLLRSGMHPDIALANVSKCFGHEDEETTLLYLKMAQDEPAGDEIYEDVLNFLGVFEDVDVEAFNHGQ